MTIGAGGVGSAKPRRVALLVLPGVLFGVTFALRMAIRAPEDDVLLLLVIPVAIAAIEFGVTGGVSAAAVALGLVLLWDLSRPDLELGAWGYVARAASFFSIGAFLGAATRARQALTARLARAEELSLDMIATAASDGYFKSLNPAWEKTLGYSLDQLFARPYLEFVHPEDRERTLEEAAALSEGAETARFRNRYRAVDGTYRWLEWSAAFAPEDGVVYAVARDVTVQQQAEDLVRREALQLEQAVRDRTAALEDARLENLTRLARAAEYRDEDTYQHTERVGAYAELIARELALDDHLVAAIRLAAPLHDLGKIGVPDHILLKPGRLSDEEFELIKTHTRVGAAILADSQSELLQMGEEIALSHHERWDGHGYPAQLAGEAIPVTGRIVAVADAYDAMTQTRPYRAAMSPADAVAELERCAGTQFDRRVTDAFLRALSHEPLAAIG